MKKLLLFGLLGLSTISMFSRPITFINVSQAMQKDISGNNNDQIYPIRIEVLVNGKYPKTGESGELSQYQESITLNVDDSDFVWLDTGLNANITLYKGSDLPDTVNVRMDSVIVAMPSTQYAIINPDHINLQSFDKRIIFDPLSIISLSEYSKQLQKSKKA